MKITVENRYKIVTLETKDDEDETLTEVQELFVDALRALTYVIPYDFEGIKDE